MTRRASEWKGYGAPMRCRQPCPCLLWWAAPEGDSRVLTEEMVMTCWGLGVTQIDRVWEMWVHLPPSPRWPQRRGWRLRSSAFMA